MEYMRISVSIKILEDGRLILPVQSDVELIASLDPSIDETREVYLKPVKFGAFFLEWSMIDRGWELRKA